MLISHSLKGDIDLVNVPLSISWNLIGWFNNYNSTSSGIAENITGCLSISKWDSINQT
jgi:hypothetical protein